MRAADRPDPRPLRPRAARVLYNAADAWAPADPADCAPDVAAALAALLADPRARRRVERLLLWLEQSPRLALHARSGFSWLPRDARRAWLERLERRGPRRVRAALNELRGLVASALAAGQSRPGA
jgi:hypothetical protein